MYQIIFSRITHVSTDHKIFINTISELFLSAISSNLASHFFLHFFHPSLNLYTIRPMIYK